MKHNDFNKIDKYIASAILEKGEDRSIKIATELLYDYFNEDDLISSIECSFLNERIMASKIALVLNTIAIKNSSEEDIRDGKEEIIKLLYGIQTLIRQTIEKK